MFARLLAAGGMFYRNGSGALAFATSPAAGCSAMSSRTSTPGTASARVAVIEAAGGRSNDFLAGDGSAQGNRLIAGPPGLYPALEALFEESA